MRVFVYYNLHKHCLSIRAQSGPDKGKVVGYACALVLEDVEFRVSQAGRQRVLRERAKNVHAGLAGTLKWHQDFDNKASQEKPLLPTLADEPGIALSYDPYRWSTFVRLTDEQPVARAACCQVLGKTIQAWGVELART